MLAKFDEELSENLLPNKVGIFRPRAHPRDVTAGRRSQDENLLSVNTAFLNIGEGYN